MNIGHNLRYFRELKGLTQQQVADRLFIERSTYAKYETDVSEPNLKGLSMLTTVFGVDYNTILNYNNK